MSHDFVLSCTKAKEIQQDNRLGFLYERLLIRNVQDMVFITSLVVQLLFCGPLKCDSGMLKKLGRETRIWIELLASHSYFLMPTSLSNVMSSPENYTFLFIMPLQS